MSAITSQRSQLRPPSVDHGHGEGVDSFELMSRLAHVDAAGNPARVLHDIAEAVAHALRLSTVSIELSAPSSPFTVSAHYGEGGGKAMTLPLDPGAGMAGQLTLAASPGQEPPGAAAPQLLDTLVRQVSAVASTVLLTHELQKSRERIVMAQEEERRRLHHRLHDGIAPNLAAGVMQLEVIRNLLQRNPCRAAELLDAQIAMARQLIGDVRGLVFNLRPPALDQLGLAGALRERASYLAQPHPDGKAAMRIEVEELGSMDGLPAAVEVAAFWIGVEAVSNAVRHAEATTCRLRLVRRQDLCLDITDDGDGLPERVTPGGGWISMRERAEELGGTCTMQRCEVRGSVVRARLPIPGGRGLQ